MIIDTYNNKIYFSNYSIFNIVPASVLKEENEEIEFVEIGLYGSADGYCSSDCITMLNVPNYKLYHKKNKLTGEIIDFLAIEHSKEKSDL